MTKISFPQQFRLKVGTQVTFSYADSTQAEGTIVKRFEAGRSGSVSYSLRVLSGIGAGTDWSCLPNDIISFNPAI